MHWYTVMLDNWKRLIYYPLKRIIHIYVLRKFIYISIQDKHSDISKLYLETLHHINSISLSSVIHRYLIFNIRRSPEIPLFQISTWHAVWDNVIENPKVSKFSMWKNDNVTTRSNEVDDRNAKWWSRKGYAVRTFWERILSTRLRNRGIITLR